MIDTVAEGAADKGLLEAALEVANSVWFVAAEHWTTLTTIYVIGAVATLFALLYRAWRDDAEEASWAVPDQDPYKINRVAHEIGRKKRPERVRRLITHTAFWPVVLVLKVAWKLFSLVFFLPLFIADRGRERAFKDGLRRGMNGGHPSKGAKPKRGAIARFMSRVRGHRPKEMTCDGCLKDVPVTQTHYCEEDEDEY